MDQTARTLQAITGFALLNEKECDVDCNYRRKETEMDVCCLHGVFLKVISQRGVGFRLQRWLVQAKLSISKGKRINFLSSAGFPLANMFWPLNSDSDPKQGSLVDMVLNWNLTVELTTGRAGIAWNLYNSEWVGSGYQSGWADNVLYRPRWPCSILTHILCQTLRLAHHEAMMTLGSASISHAGFNGFYQWVHRVGTIGQSN